MKVFLVSFIVIPRFVSESHLRGCSIYSTYTVRDAKRLFWNEHSGEALSVTKVEVL